MKFVRKPRKVILEPHGGKIVVCHNKYCRKVIRGHFKEMEFKDGYKPTVCLACFLIMGKGRSHWRRGDKS